MTAVTETGTRPVSRTFKAIGTTATVVVAHDANADVAARLLEDELRRIDQACSRFRPDSELERVHAAAGEPVRVSGLLFSALQTACEVARRTHGAVDPTVGNAIAALGYDRDLEQIVEAPSLPTALGPVAGFAHIHLDAPSRTVRIPRGVRLDLGSSTKALAADRAAARIAAAVDDGVLVSLGGDIAVAGPAPVAGWAVGLAPTSSASLDQVEQVVALHRGGLASSSTSARTWRAGGRQLHHIVNPRTGACVEPSWSLVTAVGATCVDANALTTAALVWGEDAPARLEPFGQAVRLVHHDGRIVLLNGWPEDVAS
jgi:thiamine biosynthesis lipoprotein